MNCGSRISLKYRPLHRGIALDGRIVLSYGTPPDPKGGSMQGEIINHDPVHVVEADLAREFEGRLAHDVIASLAEEEVASLDDSRVRSFVPILAWRRARDRAMSLVRGD